MRFQIPLTEDYTGKSVTLKTKLYIPHDTVTVGLFLNDTSKATVDVPSSGETSADVELTTTILEDTEYIKLNLSFNSCWLGYVDSIECYIE